MLLIQCFSRMYFKDNSIELLHHNLHTHTHTPFSRMKILNYLPVQLVYIYCLICSLIGE